MRVETKKMFITDDGESFEFEADAKRHEAEVEKLMSNTGHFIVLYKPDLNEGRGFYSKAKVEVYAECYGERKLFLEDYLVRTLGRPIKFVQGCQATASWFIREVTRDEWLKTPDYAQLGDYKHPGIQLRLVMGRGEVGLVPDEKSKQVDFVNCKRNLETPVVEI